MATVPRYVQILQALQDAPEHDHIYEMRTAASYCSWLVSGAGVGNESKANILKKLSPYLPTELDFEATHGTSHTEEEQGTEWALFAGFGSAKTREHMWPLIRQKLEADSKEIIGTNRFRWTEADIIKEWEKSDRYIFHIVICCSQRMKDMIELIQADNARTLDERFPQEQHFGMNAAGFPCIHLAARSGRLEIVKHLLNLKPRSLNQRFGSKAQTVLHSAIRGEQTDVITYLLQEAHGINHTIKDVSNKTPVHLAISKASRGFDSVNLLYNAMSAEEKSTMNGCELLHETVLKLQSTTLERVLEIITLISGDYNFDWSAHSRCPYVTALDLFREMSRWLADSSLAIATPRATAYRESLRDASISMLHKLNDSLVPLRYYDDHGTTAILQLFQSAPLEIMQAILESLPKRRQKRGEVLICSSIDKDGDTGSHLALRRGPEFVNVAEVWREQDMHPEVLQHFIHHKDFRQAAELLLSQQRFEEALIYLGMTEENDWTRCMCAAAYLGLQDYQRAQRAILAGRLTDGLSPSVLRLRSRIAMGMKRRSEFIGWNRAAYATEEQRGRDHEMAMAQKELCEEVLEPSALPAEIRNMIAKHLVE